MTDFTRIDDAIQNSSFGSEGARALCSRPEARPLEEPEAGNSAAIIDMWALINAAAVMTPIADLRATPELKELVGPVIQRLYDAYQTQYELRDLDLLRDGALTIFEHKRSESGRIGLVSALLYESIFEHQGRIATRERCDTDSSAG